MRKPHLIALLFMLTITNAVQGAQPIGYTLFSRGAATAQTSGG